MGLGDGVSGMTSVAPKMGVTDRDLARTLDDSSASGMMIGASMVLVALMESNFGFKYSCKVTKISLNRHSSTNVGASCMRKSLKFKWYTHHLEFGSTLSKCYRLPVRSGNSGYQPVYLDW